MCLCVHTYILEAQAACRVNYARYDAVMADCWRQDPDLRPTFSSLRSQLARLSAPDTTDSNYYDLTQLRP